MREYPNTMVNFFGCIGRVIVDIHVKFLEVDITSNCCSRPVCVPFIGPVLKVILIIAVIPVNRQRKAGQDVPYFGETLASLLLFPTNMDAGLLDNG
jgi:hypothetical protein